MSGQEEHLPHLLHYRCHDIPRILTQPTWPYLPFAALFALLRFSLTVDLYPLALHVNMCDASGHVGSRERLMLESHYVTVGEMLAHALASPRLKSFQRGMTSVGAPPTPSQVRLIARCILTYARLFPTSDERRGIIPRPEHAHVHVHTRRKKVEDVQQSVEGQVE